jgi:hypothetical protein
LGLVCGSEWRRDRAGPLGRPHRSFEGHHQRPDAEVLKAEVLYTIVNGKIAFRK